MPAYNAAAAAVPAVKSSGVRHPKMHHLYFPEAHSLVKDATPAA